MKRPALAAAALTLLFASEARAIGGAECIDASMSGQELRDQGHLQSAIESFGKCLDVGCPAALRAECFKWMEETQARMPTFALAARDADGNDLVAVSVLLDGVRLTDRLDGKSRATDPGVHRLVATAAGFQRLEREFLLREGERRLIDLTFARVLPVARDAPPRSDAGTPDRTRTILAPVLGAVSVAALVGAAVFWTASVSQLHDLRATCSPACTDDAVAPLRTKIALSYTSAALAIVAGATAAWLWF